MTKNLQKELITLKGRLKMGITSKISVNGDEYYAAPLEVSEAEKNGEKISDQFVSIYLIFWKKDFDSQTQSVIDGLKEGQNIIVHGNLGGNDNGLLRVTELIVESETDYYI